MRALFSLKRSGSRRNELSAYAEGGPRVVREGAFERLLRARVRKLALEGRNMASIYFALCQERLIEDSDASAELVAKLYGRTL